MFRIAQKSDIPQIASLWQEAFGDSRETVEEFFRAFPDCISFVAEEQGRVCAMVHAIPQMLSPDIPAAYIYAVATEPDSRGRGLCRELMAFAEADLKQQGVSACFLTPATASLFEFYKKLGYSTGFFRRTSESFSHGTPISPAEYAAQRETLLTVPHPVCDENFLLYAKKLYNLTFFRTKSGIAAVGPDGPMECLPEDLGGEAFAMVKWFVPSGWEEMGYLGFPLQ